MVDIRKSLTLVVVVWLLTMFAIKAAAQTCGMNAQMIGSGASATALVQGVDALGINPALIDPPKGRTVSIALVPTTFQAGTDFLDYDMYVKYFTGVRKDIYHEEPYHLTSADKQVILRSFKSDVGRIYTDDMFRLFGATVGTAYFSLGVDVTDRVRTNITLPRSLMEFVLYGNIPGKTFDLKTARVQSSWIRDYGFTFARRFVINPQQNHSISVGATLKYLQGFGYFGVDRFNTVLTTDPDAFVIDAKADLQARYSGTEWIIGRESQFNLFPAPVGSGLGLDFGAQMRVSDLFSFGVAITDFGSVKWTRNAKRISASDEFTLSDMTSDKQLNEIIDRLSATESNIPSFSTSLPSAITFAGAYTIPTLFGRMRPLHLTVAVREGLSDDIDNTTIPRFAMGLESHFTGYFAFRAGASFGGISPAMLACGASLKMDRLTVDLATCNVEDLFTRHFSVISFAVSGRLDL
jgi:hypothetical protein